MGNDPFRSRLREAPVGGLSGSLGEAFQERGVTVRTDTSAPTQEVFRARGPLDLDVEGGA